MTTANKITVVRILMIPAFVTMAIYYGESIQRQQNESETELDWESGNGLPNVRDRLGHAATALPSAHVRRHRGRSFHSCFRDHLRIGRRPPITGGGTRARAGGLGSIRFCSAT